MLQNKKKKLYCLFFFFFFPSPAVVSCAPLFSRQTDGLRLSIVYSIQYVMQQDRRRWIRIALPGSLHYTCTVSPASPARSAVKPRSRPYTVHLLPQNSEQSEAILIVVSLPIPDLASILPPPCLHPHVQPRPGPGQNQSGHALSPLWLRQVRADLLQKIGASLVSWSSVGLLVYAASCEVMLKRQLCVPFLVPTLCFVGASQQQQQHTKRNVACRTP